MNTILTDLAPAAAPKEKSRTKRKPSKALLGSSYFSNLNSLTQSAFNARFKKPRILYDDNLNVRWN